MPITTAAEIKARWPFLSETDDAILDSEIDISETSLDEAFYQDLYKIAVQLSVVHTMVTEYEYQVSMGYKLKQQEGELRIAYPQAQEISYWMRSQYGERFLDISNTAANKTIGVAIGVV